MNTIHSPIQLRNIHFAYTRHQPLFTNLSLSLHTGHIYGLLGPNGAGKTSLLKLITGVLFPQKGQALLWNQLTTHRNAQQLARIYFLQEELGLPPWKPTQLIQLHGKFYPNFSEAIFHDCIHQLGPVPNLPLPKMSRGMRQKVAIALALAAQTDILILDEPFKGLDIPSRHAFRQLLAQHFSASRIIIISTHELREAQDLVDSVIFLWNGSILVQAPLTRLASKLNVIETTQKPSNALYAEEIGSHWKALVPANQEGNLDIEFLFIAAIRSERIRHYLHTIQTPK